MWWAKTTVPPPGYPQAGYSHALVAEERLAYKNGDDIAYQPQPDEDKDIDGGVGIEPEQELVEEHLASHSGIEETHAKYSLKEHHQERHADELGEDKAERDGS